MKFLYYALMLIIPHGLLAMEKSLQQDVIVQAAIEPIDAELEKTFSELEDALNAADDASSFFAWAHPPYCIAGSFSRRPSLNPEVFTTNLSKARAILAADATKNLSNIPNFSELFYLHLANPAILELLIEYGMDANKLGYWGSKPPLYDLCESLESITTTYWGEVVPPSIRPIMFKDIIKSAQLLLAHGSDINAAQEGCQSVVIKIINNWQSDCQALVSKVAIDAINPGYRLELIQLLIDESKKRMSQQAKKYVEDAPITTYFKLLPADFRRNLLQRYTSAQPLNIFLKDVRGETALEKAQALRSIAQSDSELLKPVDQLLVILTEYAQPAKKSHLS